MPTGLRATKQIGMNLTTEDSDKNYEEELSTMVEWSDNDFWSRTSSETFATSGCMASIALWSSSHSS